ncbi:hypothetical protein TSOC_013624, partial [Tetrabaena socialis]
PQPSPQPPQSNYAALATLGPQLEAVAGSQRFTATVVASAAAATLLSLALNGGRRSLGASGAVFGVAGALWRYHGEHAALLPPEGEAALRGAAQRAAWGAGWYHLMLWSRLDVSAHVGGALGGWAAAAAWGPTYTLEGGGGGLLGFLWGAGGGRAAQFRDRPRLRRWADAAPRAALPVPGLGPGYSLPAETAAARVKGVAGRR